MLIRPYLRASTKEQDAERAKNALAAFCDARNLTVAAWYTENASGASLQRPELFRLLSDAREGDVILLEAVDRISRLNEADWQRLKTILAEKNLKIVSADLPTSWPMVEAAADDITSRVFAAINAMMIDMMAAFARKDYEDRRRRQAEGQEKAKRDGKYLGRPADKALHARISALLQAGLSFSQIQEATRRQVIKDGKAKFTKVSRTTIARISKVACQSNTHKSLI